RATPCAAWPWEPATGPRTGNRLHLAASAGRGESSGIVASRVGGLATSLCRSAGRYPEAHGIFRPKADPRDAVSLVPQVAPLWTSYALHRFESNARSATVLGFIGAGGIGQLLFSSMQAFQFNQVAGMFIVIVAAVTLIDLLSRAMRSWLI